MPASDTSTEARAVQVESRRAMSQGDRLAMGLGHIDAMFDVLAVGVRLRHPEYTDAEVEWAVRRRVVGDELLVRAWPDAPVIAP
jgi:hypothetical protein